MNYLKRDYAVYPIRLYGSFKKSDYEKLRRGFLTEYMDKNQTVFCDNTFAMPFVALKLNNLDYSSDELYKFLSDPHLNCGFSSTKEERELAYYQSNSEYKINLNGEGWYLAHILPVGKKFKYNLRETFPLRPREEWEKENKIRIVDKNITPEELETLKSHFIRFIHPLNSFIIPNTKHLEYNGKNLGEEPELLGIVTNYLEENFKEEYKEFMEAAGWIQDFNGKTIKIELIRDIKWTKNKLQIRSSKNFTEKHTVRPSKDDFSSSDLKTDLEGQEIKRVKRRVPKWMSRPNQINSIILRLFLKLSNKNEKPVSLNLLEENFRKENPGLASKFKTNYSQMKKITPNNHAKVFEEKNNSEIKLWEPVKEIIISLYDDNFS